jgi:hypothetical protein
MSQPQDIDHVLDRWPYEHGVVSARLVRAHDGREVLQMRVEMGVLQMETCHRPDGERPDGAETYLDLLLRESVHFEDDFELTEEQCIEVDREFVQFYHRRICWLALREFRRAVEDADHTLCLMDFVVSHSPHEEWTRSHERYRPLVLFHRTQAAALAKLDDSPEEAIEEINRGLGAIRRAAAAPDDEQLPAPDDIVGQLHQLQGWIREQYDIGRTLDEQLADAVRDERYELAAELRDKIAARRPRRF